MSLTLTELDRAARVVPRRLEDYNNRGVARRTRGDLEGALADFDRALGLRPGYPEAHNNRGVVRHAAGDLAGALADFEEALRIAPKYVEAYSNRASARHAAGDLAGAVADCDRALALEPGHAAASSNRGMARLALGDFAGALADFDRAAAAGSAPLVAAAHRGRGDALAALGDFVAAIDIDFYSVILHEVGHSLGFIQHGDITFEGPDGSHVGDSEHPHDLMNPATGIGGRNLISDFDAQELASTYGYTVSLPSARETMLAVINKATGELAIRGELNQGAVLRVTTPALGLHI